MNFIDSVVKSSNTLIKDRISSSLVGLEQLKIGESLSSLVANVDEKFNNLTLPKKANPDSRQKDSSNPKSDCSSDEQATIPACEEQAQDNKLQNKLKQNEHSDQENHQNILQQTIERKEPNSDINVQLAAIAADAQAVGQKTVVGAMQLGNYLLSMGVKASQTVSETACKVKQAVESTSIVSDFTREQKEFMKQQSEKCIHHSLDGSKTTDDTKDQVELLPWAQFDKDDQANVREALREQVLNLSQYKQSFLDRSKDSNSIDVKLCYPTALALLKEDANLDRVRFALVPKVVSEETFWQNYFSRIESLTSLAKNNDLNGLKSWIDSQGFVKTDDEQLGNNKTDILNDRNIINVAEQWDKESLNEYEIVSAISDDELDEAILDEDIAEFENQSTTVNKSR